MNSQKDIKNILFLCNYQAPYGGNFVASLLCLERRLNSMGHKCIYIFPETAAERFWYKQLNTEGRLVDSFNFQQNKFNKIYGIRKLIDKYHVNIIHVHFGELVTSGICGLLNSSVKIVWHLHSDFSMGNDKSTIKSTIIDFIKYKLLGRYVTIVSVSNYFVNKNNNIHYVPNGIVKNRFSQKNYTREEMRKLYNIKDNETLILLFGWSPKVKGVDIAVNAINVLQDQGNTRIKLGIICGREYVTEKMKIFIQSNTNCTGNEPWIVYLEPIEDVFQYHYFSDLFLSSSRSEGFPYSLLEALVIGNKCVVSDIPGVKWSKQYDLTIPFESENINACAQGIKKAIQNDVNNKEYVASQVAQNYSIERWCNSMVQIYGFKN